MSSKFFVIIVALLFVPRFAIAQDQGQELLTQMTARAMALRAEKMELDLEFLYLNKRLQVATEMVQAIKEAPLEDTPLILQKVKLDIEEVKEASRVMSERTERYDRQRKLVNELIGGYWEKYHPDKVPPLVQ